MKRPVPPLFAVALLIIAATSLSVTPAQAWWNKDWTLRKKITIDLSANGGAITDPVGAAPVLLRLADLNFGAAKEDGSDIRIIAADDKTPLPFHLEKFDSLMGAAFVWVRVPDLKPGATTTFWLYYGNQGTSTEPGGSDKATYDDDATLVYHFAENAAPAHDSSGHGSDSQTNIATTDSFIGPGLRLNGKTPVTIPAATSLGWTEGGSLTWSAWIKAAALQPNAVVFSRRDGAKDFLVGLDNGIPFIEINGVRSGAGAPIAAASWHHLAVTVEGSIVNVWLDGTKYNSLGAGLPGLSSVSTLGADTDPAGTNTGFVGELDELQFAKSVRPSGWIKFSAESQGSDSAKIVAISTDEAPPASWLAGTFGLFAVILHSVTADGWVVIGLLGLMALVSWYVMITKFIYVLQVQKGNALFLGEWKHVARDLTALDHAEPDSVKSLGGRASANLQRSIARAPLYHIYHIGSEEIGHRVQYGHRTLSNRAIQAIRATLDAGFVRESHKLNDGLVFLTISIAGGPFLGLLGTVVGVMITFAAIAATGEVNISAIAPGLAAALVATVAGLLVAIPALLGYNYLVSRLKQISGDMQIFIDEFVTKMAEFHSESKVEDVVP